MDCSCKDLPGLILYENHSAAFQAFASVAEGNWVRLVKCGGCGQQWRLDEPDKYAAQFAVKISDQNAWEQFDSAPLVKEFLILSRGGLSDKPCGWQGCLHRSLKDVAYCVDHLYQTGARK